MTITANGKQEELNSACTVQEYIERHGYVPEQIAVELNERIVPRTEHAAVQLQSGDVLEIVMFMGGGQYSSQK